MTDQEIICAWMEPKPACSPDDWVEKTNRWPDWWEGHADIHAEIADDWQPAHLGLNALWEVEERLTNKQWGDYRREFRLAVEREDGSFPRGERVRAILHATPEEKIKALAAVLRSLVESPETVIAGQQVSPPPG